MAVDALRLVQLSSSSASVGRCWRGEERQREWQPVVEQCLAVMVEYLLSAPIEVVPGPMVHPGGFEVGGIAASTADGPASMSPSARIKAALTQPHVHPIAESIFDRLVAVENGADERTVSVA
jgi:hypothetical protein